MTSEAERVFAYRVDANDKIESVTPDWLSFARENGASHLTGEAVVGQPLFRFVAGKETRHLYRAIVDRVRQGRRTVVPFRCDGPSVRRFMELAISSRAQGSVQFEGRIIREEPRQTVSLFDDSVTRTADRILVCGWCKRLDVSGTWLEVELAVSRMALFNLTRLPKITHGICVDCEERIRHAVEEAG